MTTDRIQQAIEIARRFPTDEWTPYGKDVITAALDVIEAARPFLGCDCADDALSQALNTWADAVLGGKP